MEKIDFKKECRQFYNPPQTAEIVELPAFRFLMIDGQGTTEGPAFSAAIEALFGVSYKAKFLCKKQLGKDYTVMPLEGLWWAEDMADFVSGNKQNWKWTLMILQPDFVGEELIKVAKREVAGKKNLPQIGQLRLETYTEGLAAQIMHIGPFSEEGPNIQKLHDLIRAEGGTFDGQARKHHEIYLSDFRKVAPEKMKTVLRQPFNL